MNVQSPMIGLTQVEEPWRNGKEIPETVEAPEGTLLLYFRATPIDIQSPCVCRAIYLVSRENGHWVYRLQPGSLIVMDNGSRIPE